MNYYGFYNGSFASRSIQHSYSTSSSLSRQPSSVSTTCINTQNVKTICLKVLKGSHERFNHEYVNVLEDNTLETVKEKICRKLHLNDQSTRFTLIKFEQTKSSWIRLAESKTCKTVADFHLYEDTLLSLAIIEEANFSKQSETSDSPTSKSFTLKLCKRPMDQSDLIDIEMKSFQTISELRDRARNKVSNQKTDHLYRWTQQGWTKLEHNSDNIKLAELDFSSDSVISFKSLNDLIPGVCGLTNLGNTCFMNSALQCLSHIPPFTERILSLPSEINAPMIGAYRSLVKTLWSGGCSNTTLSSLLINIRENLPRFARYQQQDAQEFMNHFLDLIHEEFTKERSLITELFHGKIRSTVQCLGGCNSTEINDETITFLPLPVDNDTNRYDVLFVRYNGEQQRMTVRVQGRRIEQLIESFINEHAPQLASDQIKCVRLKDNEVLEEYEHFLSLNEKRKCDLALLELPKKMVDQKYVLLVFVDEDTGQPFRPPVHLVHPMYGCFYSDIIDQIEQIRRHLYSVDEGSSQPVDQLFWVSNSNYSRPLIPEKGAQNYLSFMKQIRLVVDHRWIERHKHQFQLDQPSSEPSLVKLLDDFFRKDLLNGDYHCSTCQSLQKAKQKADLVRPLPPVLIIQLKRFTYDLHSTDKIDSFIDFPLKDLDLGPYLVDNDQKQRELYDLFAVSNHTGSLISGHYVTYAKNYRNQRWYSFNDDRTREITDEKQIVTRNAYILVYVKQTSL